MARAIYPITVDVPDAQGVLRRTFYFTDLHDRTAFWRELQMAIPSARLISRDLGHVMTIREALADIQKGQRSLLDALA